MVLSTWNVGYWHKITNYLRLVLFDEVDSDLLSLRVDLLHFLVA
jgi:hypothetical protein